MNELAGIIKTSEKDRQKYIKQLLEVEKDPVKAVKKARRIKNIIFALSVLVLLSIMLFPQLITGLVRDIGLCTFAILASVAAMHGMLIKNIPLGLEFIDWEKVKRTQDREPPPPLPSKPES